MELQFLGFVETPSEKHLGIASVRVDHKYVFRFKIAVTKDGSRHFPAAASYKIPDASGDRYVEAFVIDSRTDDEEIKKFVMEGVRKAQSSKSVFTTGNSGQSIDKNEQPEEELPF